MTTAAWLHNLTETLQDFARAAAAIDRLGHLPAPADEADAMELARWREALGLATSEPGDDALEAARGQLLRVARQALAHVEVRVEGIVNAAGNNLWNLASEATHGAALDARDLSGHVVEHTGFAPGYAVPLHALPAVVRQHFDPTDCPTLGAFAHPHAILSPLLKQPTGFHRPAGHYSTPHVIETTRLWARQLERDRIDAESYAAFEQRQRAAREEAALPEAERLRRRLAALEQQLAEREPAHAP